MAFTLAQILDTMNDRCAFVRSSAYAASTTVGDRNLVALANESAAYLRTLPLTRLRTLYTVAMTTATAYALPAGFFEYVPDTGYMESNLTPVQWPTPANVWNQYQAGNLAPGAVLYVRQYDNQINILNPVDGVDLFFEGYSSFPIAVTAAPTVPAKAAFTLDTDVWLLDDELIVRDVKWRFEKHNGFDDWQITKADFNAYLHDLLTRVQGNRTIAPGQGWPVGVPYANLWQSP